MHQKIHSLNLLSKFGLNTHNYFVPNSLYELISIVKKLNYVTIRCDHQYFFKNLPFYIVKYDAKYTFEKLKEIWEKTDLYDYKLIVSDAIKYDSIQDYNMCIKFSTDGSFECEVSHLKIPLRLMYNAEYVNSLLSFSGNVFNKIHDWEFYNNTFGYLDRTILKKDIELLFFHAVPGYYLEVTKYPIEVGKLKDYFVFWQMSA